MGKQKAWRVFQVIGTTLFLAWPSSKLGDECPSPEAACTAIERMTIVEHHGLQLSIRSVSLDNRAVVLRFRLQYVGGGTWSLKWYLPFQAHFWDQGLNDVDNGSFDFAIQDEDFLRGRKDWFDAEQSIPIPEGAEHLALQFGETPLITRIISIPGLRRSQCHTSRNSGANRR
jgi:hypothetical protein